MFFPAADTIAFSEGGVEAMRLDSAGNVGIGTNNPTSGTLSRQLTINSGAGNFAGIVLQNNATGTATTNGTFFSTLGIDSAIFNQNIGAILFGTSNAERMRITAEGVVGIGTSTPGATLDVTNGTSAGALTSYFTKGNSDPNFRLGFRNGFGTTANSEQAAISFEYVGFDTLAKIGFNRGASADCQAITFNIGGASASTERMRITAAGELLVGNTQADPTAGAGVKIFTNSIGVSVVNAASTSSDVAYRLYSTGAAAYRFYVGYDGTVFATNTTISAISDQRLKENIQDIDVGLDTIMALKPRKFDWKDGKGKDIKGDRGWIAQEFEQVFPEMINEWLDPAPEGEEPYKSVAADLIPVLVKAIQELKATVDAQAVEIAALKAK
jgi:hypothetical protein